VPNTQYVPLYLGEGTLSASVSDFAPLKYSDRITFNFKFNREVAMIGYSKLHLCFSAEHPDADVFVTLKKLDDDGNEVTFTYFTVYEHGPIAQGCLRASHRSIDPEGSAPYQPWRNHDKEEPLTPGQIYDLEIELLPATARFHPGDSLQLVIAQGDITKVKPTLAQKHANLRNKGNHYIHPNSHLLFPMVEGLDLGLAFGDR